MVEQRPFRAEDRGSIPFPHPISDMRRGCSASILLPFQQFRIFGSVASALSREIPTGMPLATLIHGPLRDLASAGSFSPRAFSSAGNLAMAAATFLASSLDRSPRVARQRGGPNSHFGLCLVFLV